MAKRKFIPIPDLSPEMIARFWSKVDVRGRNECWPWTGGLSNGYGLFSLSTGKKRRGFGANRIALFLKTGKDPESLYALHKCNFPACCNGRHLYAGTPKQNTLDCIKSGRNLWPFQEFPPKGEIHPRAKLTDKQVIDIRKRFRNHGLSTEERKFIMTELGIHRSTLKRVIHGWGWKHLTF